ncbi:site-2 protease family protein [Thalassospiraceae bacterium LMO-JJ14]|nr:site-2 protease family protein [Thalassospiraceae bacterium LMO-JJ14]
MGYEFDTIAYTISVWTLPVLLAVTLHEAAHGWVAMKLGDPTAKMLGRVTFNPFRHIDPMGTVIIPVMMLLLSGGRMMFGFAKPVPVDFRKLKNPRRDMILVAAAGPGMNLLLAILAAASFHFAFLLDGDAQDWLAQNLANAIWINILLAVFNMLPIPPLDGGRVAVGILPWPLAQRLARLERVGIFIVLGAIFLLPWIGGMIGLDLNLFQWLVITPTAHIQDFILTLVGLK